MARQHLQPVGRGAVLYHDADSRAARWLIGPSLANQHAWLRYGVAAVIVLAIGLARMALNPMLGLSAPLLPFVLAVLISATLGGFGPALLASALAPLGLSIFLLATGSAGDWAPWLAHMGFFAVLGALVASTVHALQCAYRTQGAALREAQVAERNAAQKEGRLRLIADSLPVLIAYVDDQHRYRFINGEYERWFGAGSRSFVGRHMKDVLGAANYEISRPHILEALSGRQVIYEAQLTRPDGQIRHVSAHYAPDTDGGKVRGYFALIEDITERKRTEEELQDTQQRLSLALRAGKSGTFDWEIPANANRWSEELLELYGFRCGEFAGTYEAWLASIAAEDRSRIVEEIRRALRFGHCRLEFRIRRHDTGELRWVQTRGKVFYDSADEPLRLAGIQVDVTEHKLAEQALRQSEHKLKLIYDHSSDSIFLIQIEPNERYRFVSVNETFLKVTGFARGQVENQPIDKVLPRVNQARIRAKYGEAVASGRAVVYQETAELPAGRRYGEITLIPIQSAQGVTTHILGAAKDVTAMRAAEATLREESRRKDEFLAMLAHELRNPLAPIRNVAHMLAHQSVDAGMLGKFSGILQRQANQLTRLVDDLLDVSRITRGAIELKCEPLALDAVLHGAVEMLHAALQAKRQIVNIRLGPGPLSVHGDFDRLTQVFANLLSNASKYSAEGAAIELLADAAAGEAVVRVSDPGVGIDPQMLPRVFDLFVQADRSLDRTHGGLGVGLTIVKRLAAMHGGAVEAHSAGLGHGSEFVVRLPLSGDAAPRGAPGNGAGTALAPIRILIVDDNVDAAETLAAVLGTARHEVRVVHDGAAAIPAVDSWRPALVLLDIGLPRVDGYVVAQSLRERFAEAPMKIFALTGYGREEDRALALRSGCDGHLTKPVDPAAVLRLAAESGSSAAAASSEQ
jgi:PAS domain S-box-containing protein